MIVAVRVLAICSLLAALTLAVLSAPTARAAARYAGSDPGAGTVVGPEPFVLRAWFTEELTSTSTIAVVDAAGRQVDLGDGRVDLDDPGRKVMVVSLPALPTGVYAARWVTVSAEDGSTAAGALAFGVGVVPDTPFPVVVTPGSRWVEAGYWRDNRVMTTEPFTVRGPWRIRWRLDEPSQPLYMMLLDGDVELREYTAHLGTTRGVIEEDQGGTFSLMFHNTVGYEVIVEERAGP